MFAANLGRIRTDPGPNLVETGRCRQNNGADGRTRVNFQYIWPASHRIRSVPATRAQRRLVDCGLGTRVNQLPLGSPSPGREYPHKDCGTRVPEFADATSELVLSTESGSHSAEGRNRSLSVEFGPHVPRIESYPAKGRQRVARIRPSLSRIRPKAGLRPNLFRATSAKSQASLDKHPSRKRA